MGIPTNNDYIAGYHGNSKAMNKTAVLEMQRIKGIHIQERSKSIEDSNYSPRSTNKKSPRSPKSSKGP